MQHVSISVWVLILLVAGPVSYPEGSDRAQKSSHREATWGCGYTVASPSLQYTASSFVRSYAKLIKPLVLTNKNKDEIMDIIPAAHSDGNSFP